MSPHADNCEWHTDQYAQECTCGLVESQRRELTRVMNRITEAALQKANTLEKCPKYIPIELIVSRQEFYKAIARAVYDEMVKIEMERRK
jgi:hypothetical protein